MDATVKKTKIIKAIVIAHIFEILQMFKVKESPKYEY